MGALTYSHHIIYKKYTRAKVAFNFLKFKLLKISGNCTTRINKY